MIRATELPQLKNRLKAILNDDVDSTNFFEDSDGDFVFSYQGSRYLLIFQPEDPAFVKLVYMSTLPASYVAAIDYLDSVLNAVNRHIKGVKIIHTDKRDADGDLVFHAACDFLVLSIEALSAKALTRYIGMIQAGLHRLAGQLKGSSISQDTPVALGTLH